MIKPVGELSHLNCCTLGDIQNFYLNKPDHHITDPRIIGLTEKRRPISDSQTLSENLTLTEISVIRPEAPAVDPILPFE